MDDTDKMFTNNELQITKIALDRDTAKLRPNYDNSWQAGVNILLKMTYALFIEASPLGHIVTTSGFVITELVF